MSLKSYIVVFRNNGVYKTRYQSKNEYCGYASLNTDILRPCFNFATSSALRGQAFYLNVIVCN